MFRLLPLLTTTAPDGTTTPTGGIAGFIANYGIIILLVVVMFVAFYLPERKRKKQFNDMVSGMKVGDDVYTTGGIIGKIIKIEESYIILETGPDRVRIKQDKRGIHSITSKEDKEEVSDKKEK
ncbi:MAG: preprotein translocase subunit YajC [Oscillospiraceae bacterium]|nr:preprotein translocase subunit YajC [Oscillospiraceae bacterium]